MYIDGQKKRYNRIVRLDMWFTKNELHELNMTRTLSKASGVYEFIEFCLSGM